MQDADSRREGAAARTRVAFLKVWTVIGALVLASVAVWGLGRLSDVVLFLSLGCVIAYVASPLVNAMSRHHVPRGLASILGLVVVLLGVLLTFVLVIPLFFSQMSELLREMPARIAEIGSWFASLEQDYQLFALVSQYFDVSELVRTLQAGLTQLVTTLLSAIGSGIVPAVTNFASTVFVVFLSLVLAFWIVCDYPAINDEICRVLGPARSRDYRVMLAVTTRSVGGYLRTTVIDSLIQGTLAGIGFALAGHPYAGIMGVLSGVLNFVPVVGPSVSAVIAAGIALLYSPAMAFWTVVAAVLSQNVTDNLIVPRINQSTMQIHPVMSLTAIMLGSTLMGPLGMIVAIPLCAMVKSLFIYYFEVRTGTQVVSYDGALFKGTPYLDADGGPAPACDALGDEGVSVDAATLGPDAAAQVVPAPRPALAVSRAAGALRSLWRRR